MLATLCFAAVLSLSLSSYLAVCYRSLVLSNRGMQSTHGIELAEVGMEETLWALNNSAFDGTWAYSTPLGIPTAKKTITTGFAYENGATGQVQLTVQNWNKTIASFAGAPTPDVIITTVGVVTLADHTTVSRTLQSDARPAQLFTNAIGALGSLQFAGGGLVDSYNSLNFAYDPAHPQFNAVVSGTNVDLGGSSVYGFAATKGTILQNQPSAKVTGVITGTGIDPARVSMSTTQPLYDPVQPTGGNYLYDPITSASTLTNSVILGTAGVYRLDAINLSSGAELLIQAPVVLKVNNSVQTSGTGRIHIDTGGSLELQIDENDGLGLNLQGDGIYNPTQRNVSVMVGRIYAGTSNSTIDTTNAFYGTIYLPNDTINIANNFTIYGAMIGENITFTGSSPSIHYDAALQQTGIADVNTPFALVQLREVSPSGP